MLRIFKAKSRLGLINPPLGSTTANVGVEDGPDYVISTSFQEELAGPVYEYSFTEPEALRQDYYRVMARESKELAELINKYISSGDQQLVVGGDHSVSFASLIALFDRVDPSKVGYLQFDSHADLHQISTSPSGNFHGMYLRAVVDQFENPAIDDLVPTKLQLSNVIYIGQLVTEPAEQKLLADNQVVRYSDIDSTMSAKLTDFIRQFDHIHINFDIDVLDDDEAPATGIPARPGLRSAAVLPLLTTCKQVAKSVSLDLVEVNPHLRGAGPTIKIAQAVIKTLFG